MNRRDELAAIKAAAFEAEHRKTNGAETEAEWYESESRNGLSVAHESAQMEIDRLAKSIFVLAERISPALTEAETVEALDADPMKRAPRSDVITRIDSLGAAARDLRHHVEVLIERVDL